MPTYILTYTRIIEEIFGLNRHQEEPIKWAKQMVGVTGLEPATSTTQRLYRIS